MGTKYKLKKYETTYNHVLQGTFGKPAVKKYRDKYVSQWFPEDLKKMRETWGKY